MIEVTVKTLDGKNKSFCVPDDITVKQFKEKISNSIEIPAETQRLIYQGRVLQDEKRLDEYDVNGKTIHVVQRPPPSTRATPSATSTSSSTSSTRTGNGQRDGTSFVLGSFTLPSDLVDPNQVQNIVQQVITGMGDMGRNARVSTRSSNDGSSVDVHINLGTIIPPQVQSEAQLRLNQARRMIQQAQQTLDRIENPPTPDEPRGSSPMETGAATATSADTTTITSDSASTRSSTTSSTTSGGPTTSAASSSTTSATSSSTTRPTSGTQNRSPQHPPPSALAELLHYVITLNRRLQPHFQRYHQLMGDDPTFTSNDDASRDAQRLCNLVSEALHYISHAYHSISDLMIDMTRAPPRQLSAPPTAFPQPGGFVHQAIPVQSQINLQTTVAGGMPQQTSSSSSASSTNSAPASSSATSSSATSTTSTTTSTATSTPQGPPGGPGFAMPHMSTTTLPGGGTANIASSNPYVIMELGPHAVTINSISAHVVSTDDAAAPPSGTPTTAAASSTASSTASSGPQSSAPPQGQTTHTQAFHIPPVGLPPGVTPMALPPEMMQNILQMAFPRPPVPGANSTQTFTSSFTTNSSTNGGRTSSPAGGSTRTSPAGGSTRTSPAGGSTRTPAGGATRTSTTSSLSQSQAGGQQGRPQGAAFIIPGSSPFGAPSSIDPFLPCNSRHFLGQRAASQQAAAPNQADGLAGMVSNLMSSLLNQQNPHLQPHVHPQPQPQQRSGAPATSSATSFSSSTSTSSSNATAGPTPTARPAGSTQAGQMPSSQLDALNAFQQMLQDWLLRGQYQPPPQPTAGQGQGQVPGFTDEVFSQLVQGISTYLTQAALGQQPTETITDFLSSLGQTYDIGPGEGLLPHLLDVIARTLTFTNIMALFSGQPQPLDQMQGPLQDLVRTTVLQGQPMTDANLQSAVERIMDDMGPEIDLACESVRGRDNIDFCQTLHNFTRHHVAAAIRFVMQSTEIKSFQWPLHLKDYTPSSAISTYEIRGGVVIEGDATYGERLYNMLQTVIHEFIALVRHCLEEQDQALEQFITGRMRYISRDVNPIIRQWMVTITIRELHRILPSVQVSQAELDPYIQRPGAMETSPQSQSSEGSFMSAESVEAPDTMSVESTATLAASQAASHKETETMDVDSPAAPAQADSAKVVETAVEAVAAASVDVDTLAKRLPPPPEVDPEDEANVVMGSENWHQTVPSNWVPIITRDIRRQSREGPQPPFSDSYLNGMPAKRRKVMASKQPESDLSDLANIVPETLRRAVAVAGVEPHTSIEEVTREAATSTSLHAAFERQVCDSVRARINRDPDYVPEKYPNTEKFFKGEKK